MPIIWSKAHTPGAMRASCTTSPATAASRTTVAATGCSVPLARASAVTCTCATANFVTISSAAAMPPSSQSRRVAASQQLLQKSLLRIRRRQVHQTSIALPSPLHGLGARPQLMSAAACIDPTLISEPLACRKWLVNMMDDGASLKSFSFRSVTFAVVDEEHAAAFRGEFSGILRAW